MRNAYEIVGSDIAIHINGRNGEELTTFVSVQDFDIVDSISGSWRARWDNKARRYYVVFQTALKVDGRFQYPRIFLHRLLLDAPKNMLVDHVDNDPLNNRRGNLRLATPAENSRNRYSLPTNTSGYRGVTWHSTGKKWQASLTETDNGNRRCRYLGLFSSPIEAARAYDREARARYGDFARLNFPNDNERSAA